MKNKSSSHRSSYFFRQRIYHKDINNTSELIKLHLEGHEIELKNILRWEDDGGHIVIEVPGSGLRPSSHHLPLVNELYT